MQEFFQDRRNQAMFGGTVLFMFIFPIYFALVPSLVGLDDAGLSDSSGTWEVSFTEETFTQIEKLISSLEYGILKPNLSASLCAGPNSIP